MALFGQSSFVGGGSTSFGTTAGKRLLGRKLEHHDIILNTFIPPLSPWKYPPPQEIESFVLSENDILKGKIFLDGGGGTYQKEVNNS